MQYRQRSELFAASWLILGVAAVGPSGGITVADFEKPELLIVASFVGIIIEMSVPNQDEQTSVAREEQVTREGTALERAHRTGALLLTPAAEPFRPVDAADQLRILMRSKFTIQPLLNKSEARVFRELSSFVIGRKSCWQVMARVSLGASAI
ncbi:hypothetical protein RJJ11_14250 [Rhizobium hidalgonense]|nr:hypothetical protein [Rhizobium hidalgonense]MDR9805483.1 hypothetical protein [Rhizobium hidalgonense]